MKNWLLIILFFINYPFCFSQGKNTKWDNTSKKTWPKSFQMVRIPSSKDETLQKAMFYSTKGKNPQPLIVSLHTWSGNYHQGDPLTEQIIENDWNYIHPDFRGPNNSPQACGSHLVIADIQDAIHYAIKHANVDTTEVHIIGVSGGGYATLLCFMKLFYPVKTFNAWAPISDLQNWYWQCKGRNLKYANDLENVTTGGKGFDPEVARKRSPVFMPYNPSIRKGAALNIYEGIHDGYTGSVPITQSLKFFNHILRQMYPEQEKRLISDSMMLSLVTKQINPCSDSTLKLGNRRIYLHRELPRLSITIFEGTHEMLTAQAFSQTKELLKDKSNF